MNNLQIEDYLKNDPNFLGCFPHDSLNSFSTENKFPSPKKTTSIIINTDSGRGEHWVAMVLTKGKIEKNTTVVFVSQLLCFFTQLLCNCCVFLNNCCVTVVFVSQLLCLFHNCCVCFTTVVFF